MTSISIYDQILDFNIQVSPSIQKYLNDKLRSDLYAINLDENMANVNMFEHLDTEDPTKLEELDAYINRINIPQLFHTEILDSLLQNEEFPYAFEYQVNGKSHVYITAEADSGNLKAGQMYRVSWNHNDELFIHSSYSLKFLATTAELEKAFPRLFTDEYMEVRNAVREALKNELRFHNLED